MGNSYVGGRNLLSNIKMIVFGDLNGNGHMTWRVGDVDGGINVKWHGWRDE